MALSAFYRVGLIVAIQCAAIVQQVAVVVPGISLTVDAGQAIGGIVGVSKRPSRGVGSPARSLQSRLGQATEWI